MAWFRWLSALVEGRQFAAFVDERARHLEAVASCIEREATMTPSAWRDAAMLRAAAEELRM